MAVVEHRDEPFDPGDPYNAMCQTFYLQIVEMVIAAHSITIYREMSVEKQTSSIMFGILTGLISVCLASVKEGGRDAMIAAITDAIPMARRQAESIITNSQQAKRRRGGA